jgi:hypothetical protein
MWTTSEKVCGFRDIYTLNIDNTVASIILAGYLSASPSFGWPQERGGPKHVSHPTELRYQAQLTAH